MDRNDALRKFQSLRRMTVARGATPAEAETAQGLADRLAARFGFGPADDATRPDPMDALNEYMRQARQQAARNAYAQAARDAAARAAREQAARDRYNEQRRRDAEAGSRQQARQQGRTWDRQWQYDYEAARRTWHWESRKCGKANCWCRLVDVKTGQGHGPYRYGKRRTGAKVNSVYLGRGTSRGSRPA